jgi:hypothetical protein
MPHVLAAASFVSVIVMSKTTLQAGPAQESLRVGDRIRSLSRLFSHQVRPTRRARVSVTEFVLFSAIGDVTRGAIIVAEVFLAHVQRANGVIDNK